MMCAQAPAENADGVRNVSRLDGHRQQMEASRVRRRFRAFRARCGASGAGVGSARSPRTWSSGSDGNSGSVQVCVRLHQCGHGSVPCGSWSVVVMGCLSSVKDISTHNAQGPEVLGSDVRSRSLLLLSRRRTYDEHGARRVVLDALRGAADQHRVADPAAAAGHHDQPGVQLGHGLDDLFGRRPGADLLVDLGSPPVEHRRDGLDRGLGCLAEPPVSRSLRRRSTGERSSANATAASGRITATTEMSVILAGSANDFSCLAARSDCWLPSVATTTCITGLPSTRWWVRRARPPVGDRSSRRSTRPGTAPRRRRPGRRTRAAT